MHELSGIAFDATATTLGAKDRSVWALFEDWCAGADLAALPADPVALAQFIAENPAALATQRRRVATINTVHRIAGHPAPGSADTIRRMLNQARAARLSHLASTVARIIDRLPTAGWTAGLFGRRDGLVLLLAASGLSFEQISALHRGDLSVDGEALVIESVHPIRLEPFAHPGSLSPAQVYRRWLQVLEFQDRAPSTALLADRLAADTLPTKFLPRSVTEERVAQRMTAPLFTPIDRWGHTPFDRSALSAQSIASILAAHVSGQSPVHRPHHRKQRLDEVPKDYQPEVYPEVVLDDLYYERGIEARHATQEVLSDVADILDDVEARADATLKQLLAVLDGEF
ncbi:recombinase [Rhodococcus sp. NCIMB 12038]|uniref:recombinase n=1 Tax=Rhodococcus sp. NCIMB 12038 TaxID=933800 RepID=UPI000B3C87E2|nr:recombinase [Rhodococcus sp. NCIMB 12038]OUS97260.1 recombinase [Rhodococcus sp. NCIMB 12038]